MRFKLVKLKESHGMTTLDARWFVVDRYGKREASDVEVNLWLRLQKALKKARGAR